MTAGGPDPESPGEREREERLDRVIAEYLESADRGAAPDRKALLEKHSDLSPALGEFLEEAERLGRVARALGSSPPPPPRVGEGQRIGDHEILVEIARGGMGVVYKARHVRLNRLVALKVIQAGCLASVAERERFRLEAEAAASLDHPHIVPIHEVGAEEGVAYYSMKLLEGGSLADLLDSRRLEPRAAAVLLETTARAVHYAHERGVLHRDLKPANILLDLEGGPHVSDFGLAKRVGGDGGLTLSGEIVGTPSYMAPEQASGKRSAVTKAVDVYSLGAILYETLTGRAPFRAESSIDTLRMVLEEDPAAPRTIDPRIPRDLETIALKCLEKDPARRYASAEALAEDLGRFQKGESILARRATIPERGWRWLRRNPAAALVALLLVVIAVGSSVAALSLRGERNAALENLRQSYIGEARSGRTGGEAGRRFGGLSLVAKAAAIRKGVDVRSEAIACMALPDLEVERRWDGFPPGTTELAFDATLERYARGDAQGRISVRDVASDREIRAVEGTGRRVLKMRFSRDGRLLAASHGDEQAPSGLRILDLERGEVIQIAADLDPSGVFDFHPGSGSVAVSGRDGFLRILEVLSGRELRRLGRVPSPQTISFHPGGRLLAVSYWQESFEVFDLEGSGEGKKFPYPKVAYGVAWHPEREILAVGGTDFKTHLFNVRAAVDDGTCNGHESGVVQGAFSPGGEFLATFAWDGTVRLWDPVEREQLVLTHVQGSVLAFSQDGTRLAFGLQPPAVWTWRVADGLEYRLLHGADAAPSALEFSPEGDLLAATGPEGFVVWELSTRQERIRLALGLTESIMFEPSGRSLVTSGHAGLLRWPLERIWREGRETVRIGPPRRVGARSEVPLRRASLARNGKNLAVIAGYGHAVAGDIERPRENLRFFAHGNINSISMSPDGSRLATGAFNGPDVKVWDAATGMLEATLPSWSAQVLFSPDGRSLLISAGVEYVLLDAATLKPRLRFAREDPSDVPGQAVFSPDGKVLAVTRSRRATQLIDLQTGEEIATLRGPTLSIITSMCFSPDGTSLAIGIAAGEVRIWDLRLIRDRLGAMGLDWDAPPYPPPAGDAKPVISFEADISVRE